MKLLFTQDALVNAGAERSHLEILSRFSKEVKVVFVYFYSKHDLKAEYEKVGIRLIFLNIREKYHFLLAVTRLVNLIKKEKPNLLISSLWRADIITRIASMITGVPLVGTLVNDSYAPIAWKDKKGLKYKVVYWLDRLTAGIPIHWIANANALAESHVTTLGLKRENISVVYRGRRVPGQKWRKAGLGIRDLVEGSPNSYRSENGSTQTERDSETDCRVVPPRNDGPELIFRFLSYGRLLERKGFQDAIESFSIVIQKYPNCTLTIYGEGPYRASLESLINRLGLEEKVQLPGKFNGIPNPFSPNLNSPNLLLSSDCFLFPSWYEGFSGSLVEAMMAGIPIIASDISMNLEAISSDNALIFEVQNIAKLANQMLFAIEHPDLMADLGAKARKEAVARFNIEKIAKEYEELLHVIARKNQGL
jgi:glycosyltransferase involved in cell wall biosynthesis